MSRIDSRAITALLIVGLLASSWIFALSMCCAGDAGDAADGETCSCESALISPASLFSGPDNWQRLVAGAALVVAALANAPFHPPQG